MTDKIKEILAKHNVWQGLNQQERDNLNNGIIEICDEQKEQFIKDVIDSVKGISNEFKNIAKP